MNEAVVALEGPLGLAVAGVEDDPAQRELAAEGEERLGRLTARRDRTLAVPNELCRQRTEPLKAAAHAPGNVGKLLREDQGAGKGARVGQLAGDEIALAQLIPADRDLAPGLGEVELGQLAGSVDGALVGARRWQVAGAELAQEIVEDRLAAAVAELFDLLADADARERRLLVEQSLDLTNEGTELRGALRPRPVARRLVCGERATDRVAVDPGQAVNLPLRSPLDLRHPPDLRPLLHVKQLPSPGLDLLVEPGSEPGRMAPALRRVDQF